MTTTPSIRDKSDRAFRTISEAAETIGVPQHVLRFWETRFSQLQPLKRGGNRRYYRPADMALLETIRAMLHDEGLTIRGAQLALAAGKDRARTLAPITPATADLTAAQAANAEMARTEAGSIPVVAAFDDSAAPASAFDIAPLIAIRDRLRFALAA